MYRIRAQANINALSPSGKLSAARVRRRRQDVAGAHGARGRRRYAEHVRGRVRRPPCRDRHRHGRRARRRAGLGVRFRAKSLWACRGRPGSLRCYPARRPRCRPVP